jgi:hypothetical protein
MKKRIEYAVKNEGVKLLMQITAQSHRNATFGEDGTNSFKSKNGMELHSRNYPDYDRRNLYVRGNDTDNDPRWFPVPPSQLAAILEAIEEYNAYDFEDTVQGILHIPSEYRDGAEQLVDLMNSLDESLDEIPEEYRKAAVAAWAFKVWGFKSYANALEELGCQKDNVDKMLEDFLKDE